MTEMVENSRKEIKKLYELLNKRKNDHEGNIERMQLLRQDNNRLANENKMLNESSFIFD